jgi:RimJ/RimL family protein N-acetyltransferase
MRYWHPDGAYTQQRAERSFASSLEAWETRGFGKRSALVRETGEWIGFVEACPVGAGVPAVADDVEIGWLLKRSAWGRGYGTEAGRAIRDEAFERLGLDTIVALCRPENVASVRIMEKLGMTYEQEAVGAMGEQYLVYRLSRTRWTAPEPQRRAGGPAQPGSA